MPSPLARLCEIAGNLLRTRAGNVMPMAAIAMIALAGMIGGGVDASRAYMVKNRLQSACDAGVLAGRRSVTSNGFDSTAEARARTYFDTNFDEESESTTDTTFLPTSADNGNEVTGTASTTMDTAVMRLFGYDEIPLAVSCSASMSVGNSDVMMVLDTTGSMACTSAMSDSQCSNYINNNGYSETAHGSTSRLQDLRTAMTAFYGTVASATVGSNARVRYGFVPYSSSINVGYLLDPSYLSTNVPIQSRKAKYKTTTNSVVDGYESPTTSTGTPGYSSTVSSNWVQYAGPYSKNKDCKDDLPDTTSWANSGSSTSSMSTTYSGNVKRETTTTYQPQSQTEYMCSKGSNNKWYVEKRTNTRNYQTYNTNTYQPHYTTVTVQTFDGFNYYQRSDFDITSYIAGGSTISTGTGTNGANQSWTWAGCIEERATVNDATFSYSTLLGLSPSGATDLDIDSAPTGDSSTKWKPLWAGLGYIRTTGGGGVTQAATTTNGTAASTYCPHRAQGLEQMDATSFNTFASELTPAGSTYHDIGMIWGARLLSPTGIFQDTVTAAPANGGSVARHIIFMTDGYMAPSPWVHGTYGIEWHDERVTADGYNGQAARHNSRFLAACAQAKAKGIRVWVIAFSSGLSTELSTCSSPDSSFTASNASQLNAAFQEIAKNVGELRVIQ